MRMIILSNDPIKRFYRAVKALKEGTSVISQTHKTRLKRTANFPYILVVKEIDGDPDVDGVREIKVTNGCLTDNGDGSVTIDVSGEAADTDELVAIDTDAEPGYLGAAFNDGVLRSGSGLSYTDGGDFITLAVSATYTTISGNDGDTDVSGAELETLTDGSYTVLHNHIETRFVCYYKLLASDIDGILTLRSYTDETVEAFAAIMDVPRNVTISTQPQGGFTITGTITINGKDADGAVINEVFTINENGNTTHTGDKAFSVITSVVVDQTDESTLSRYSVGWADKLGLLNGPFNAAGDVFKVNKNGTHLATGGYTINTTYGTILLDVAIIQDDTVQVWYRPFA